MDDDSVEHYYRAEGSGSVATGGAASVDQRQYGVSDRSVVMLLIVPLAASFVAVGYSFWAGGNATARAQGAVELAQIAERNAKLAQYQLEEALKKLDVDIPKELPP